MRQTLSESSEDQIRHLFLGHRIVSAETGSFPSGAGWGGYASGKLTLDDDTQVLVIPNDGGCICGAGDYELKRLATVDNVITDVRVVREDTSGCGGPDTTYRIFVVADATEINAVDIEGSDGNGYYGTGYQLVVIPA